MSKLQGPVLMSQPNTLSKQELQAMIDEIIADAKIANQLKKAKEEKEGNTVIN